MRPPFGAHDATSDAAAGQAGLSVIIWDVDTLDWKTKSADATVAAVASGTRPGSIVLMHDTHPTSVDAVPAMIADLKAKGYTFVTVTDSLDDRGMDAGTVYSHGPR
jgi:peptidoglycan/xylan/chitin deacetylase (PgdA/CDA1 family)